MTTILEHVLIFLANLAVAVGAAYGAFVWLGKRGLEQLFARQIEKLKHEQAKQLQEQRFKIDALFNRITKIHEKEVEVLPMLWQLLHEALWHLYAMTSPGSDQADLDRMPQANVEEFLEGSRLSTADKEEVRQAVQKREKYYDIIFWYDLSDAEEAAKQFRRYLATNSIFLTSDLKEQFTNVGSFLTSALIDIRLSKESQDRRWVRNAAAKLHTQVQSTVQSIEALVQRRLRMTEA